jgi:hypothetical protein
MVLPELPHVDDEGALGQMRGPLPWCNWVIPGQVLAGAYPASTRDDETKTALTTLLGLGVNCFVCLQAEMDIHVSEEQWRSGKALRSVVYLFGLGAENCHQVFDCVHVRHS